MAGFLARHAVVIFAASSALLGVGMGVHGIAELQAYEVSHPTREV